MSVVAVGADLAPPRAALLTLTRTLSVGALAGAISGFIVGGVLGRLGMRLLAITSPDARGGVTDDVAIVGEITLAGTANLAAATTALGALGGLVYLWVRRILPASTPGRVLGFGLFTGSLGGASFVHEYPSFDYTELTPRWLAVAMFVALPLLYGLAAAALTEFADRPGGLGQRLPWVALLVAALAVSWPAVIVSAPFLVAAFAVRLVPVLGRAWRSRVVTIAGTVLFAVLVLWGVYGIVADVVSIVSGTPSPLPLNP
jgi:hypothetical protein